MQIMKKFLTNLSKFSEKKLIKEKHILPHDYDNLPRYSDQILEAFRLLLLNQNKVTAKDLLIAQTYLDNERTSKNLENFEKYSNYLEEEEKALSRIKYKTYGRDFGKIGEKLIPISDLLSDLRSKHSSVKIKIEKVA